MWRSVFLFPPVGKPAGTIGPSSVRSDAPAELSLRAKGAVLFPKRRGADRSGATARPECPRKWRITFRCMRSLPSLRRRKGRSWNAGAMGRERLLSKIGMTAGMAFLAGVRDVRTAAGTVFRRFAVCPSCERIFLAGQGGADRRWHGVSVCWRRTPAARRGAVSRKGDGIFDG